MRYRREARTTFTPPSAHGASIDRSRGVTTRHVRQAARVDAGVLRTPGPRNGSAEVVTGQATTGDDEGPARQESGDLMAQRSRRPRDAERNVPDVARSLLRRHSI